MVHSPSVIVLTSVILSAGASWLVASSHPAHARGAAPIARQTEEFEWRAEVDALRAELDRWRQNQNLIDVGAAPSAARTEVGSLATMTPASVAAIVRSLVTEDALSVEQASGAEWPGGTGTAAGALRAIFDAGINSDEAADLWKEAAANGQLHELLAEMEASMQDVPESAGKHFDRARAFHSAAKAMPSNRDGNWWVDSNNAFTKALEIDPEHFDARYEKARNMSFWPVAYGGQAEAVRHFERLVASQESGSVRSGTEGNFPRSYVWLGNLYAQQGNQEAARSAWQRGLSAFPGNEWLMERLGTVK